MINFVGVLGIEPSLHAPKARVLPIYDTPELMKNEKLIMNNFYFIINFSLFIVYLVLCLGSELN